MPSLPPTLTSLHPHASCLPRLGFRAASCPPPSQLLLTPLPLIRKRLHLSTSHCAAASHHAPLPLWCGCLSPALASPLVLPPSLVCLCLRLSLCPSHATCLDGCRVASHHTNASRLPGPLTLVAPLPLVAPLSCLLSTLAGFHVASPHDGASHLPVPLPPRNSVQAVGLILSVKPNCVYDARPAMVRSTL